MKKTRHYYKSRLAFALFVAGVLLLAYAVHVKLRGYNADEWTVIEEQAGLALENAYIMGFEAGYKKAEQDRFDEFAEIAAMIHGPSYRPDLMPPPRKPEVGA